jgi:hypothetical protein
MKQIEIPLEKVQPDFTSPRSIVVLAKHKIGKTSLAADLPNSLILDFEKGTSFIAARKVEIEDWTDLQLVSKALKDQNIQLDYIVIDTLTSFAEHVLNYAEKLYSESSIGKNWHEKYKAEYGSILNLPKGAGWGWYRTAFVKLISRLQKLAPRIVYIAHSKEEILVSGGSEVSTLDIDLPGQLKRLIAQNVDAIGYIYRKGNQNYISFKSKDNITTGTRQIHLRDKEFLISEMNPETGELKTFWNQIFID